MFLSVLQRVQRERWGPVRAAVQTVQVGTASNTYTLVVCLRLSCAGLQTGWKKAQEWIQSRRTVKQKKKVSSLVQLILFSSWNSQNAAGHKRGVFTVITWYPLTGGVKIFVVSLQRNLSGRLKILSSNILSLAWWKQEIWASIRIWETLLGDTPAHTLNCEEEMKKKGDNVQRKKILKRMWCVLDCWMEKNDFIWGTYKNLLPRE